MGLPAQLQRNFTVYWFSGWRVATVLAEARWKWTRHGPKGNCFRVRSTEAGLLGPVTLRTVPDSKNPVPRQ